MAVVLVTGSASGLGRGIAELLLRDGHWVVAHARDDARAAEVRRDLPGAEVVAGDLAELASTRRLAAQADALGPFDAVIHNAAVYERGRTRQLTADGLERTFQVNVLAPYVLLAAMRRPRRMVFLSSSMHESADVHLDDLQFARRPYDGSRAYSESKLLDIVLCFAVARRWPDAVANVVDPGWVRTRMGGGSAPVEVSAAAARPAWLAASGDTDALASGRYFSDRGAGRAHPSASDPAVQDGLLDACAALSGIPFLA